MNSLLTTLTKAPVRALALTASLAATLFAATPAHADRINWSVGVHSGGYYQPPGVSVQLGNGRYVPPRPVYVAPPPVYVAPVAPVVVAPRPVYVVPHPGYYHRPPPPRYGRPGYGHRPHYYHGRPPHHGRR